MRGIRGFFLTRKQLKLESQLADAKADMHEAKVASVVGVVTSEEFEAARDVVMDLKHKLRVHQRKISRFLGGLDEFIQDRKMYYNFLLEIAVREEGLDVYGSAIAPILHFQEGDEVIVESPSREFAEFIENAPYRASPSDSGIMN